MSKPKEREIEKSDISRGVPIEEIERLKLLI